MMIFAGLLLVIAVIAYGGRVWHYVHSGEYEIDQRLNSL